jgi:hypothetical protein
MRFNQVVAKCVEACSFHASVHTGWPERGALELWEFRIQMYQQLDGRAPVMPYRSPLTQKLRGIQDARAVVIKLATEKYGAVHSVTVTSPFGQERWFQIDGKWRYKDV